MKIDQNRLKTAMMECGMTRERIAQQTGIDLETLNRVENEYTILKSLKSIIKKVRAS